jgi:uncharacterized protein
MIPGMVQEPDDLVLEYPMAPEMIDFGATGVFEVFQNVKYIVLTTVFSVPLDREFGIDATFVDKPMNVAEYIIAQEVAFKINLYEPRARFRDITFSADIDGKLAPNITIDVDLTQPLGPRTIPPTLGWQEQLEAITISPTPPSLNGYATGEPSDLPPWLRGPQGKPGSKGEPGPGAWTISDATFVIPPLFETVDITVIEPAWMTVGEWLWIEGAGEGGEAATLKIVGIAGNIVTLLNNPYDVSEIGGPPGPPGTPGSKWYNGQVDPPQWIEGANIGDYYLNMMSGAVFELT